MNPKIKQLAEKAGLRVESWMTNPPKPFQILGDVEAFEKFAELVIAECVKEIHGADLGDVKGKSYYLDKVAEHIEITFKG